eukprot:6202286-Pleurochrysis_carterae.AAC.1
MHNVCCYDARKFRSNSRIRTELVLLVLRSAIYAYEHQMYCVLSLRLLLRELIAVRPRVKLVIISSRAVLSSPILIGCSSCWDGLGILEKVNNCLPVSRAVTATFALF